MAATEAYDSLNILDLNYDCLENINKHLNNEAQVNFAFACRQFFKLKNNLLVVDDIQSFDLTEIEIYLEVIGPYIEQIISERDFYKRNKILQIVSKYCVNVKKLTLCNNIKDEYLCAFKDLEKLKELWLSGRTYNADKLFFDYKSLHTLEELHLFCPFKESKFLHKCLKSLKQPQAFDMPFRKLPKFDYERMAATCENLQVLELSLHTDLDYGFLTRMPRLRVLLINSTFEWPGELLRTLRGVQKLEELHISSTPSVEDCFAVVQLRQLKTLGLNGFLTDEHLFVLADLINLEQLNLHKQLECTSTGLLSIVQTCNNLRRINIGYFKNINTDFVYGVIEILKNRRQRNLLQLDVSGEIHIEKEILNVSRNIEENLYQKMLPYWKTKLCPTMLDFRRSKVFECCRNFENQFLRLTRRNYSS